MECNVCGYTLEELFERDTELLFPVCSDIVCEKCLSENPTQICPICGKPFKFFEEYQEPVHDTSVLKEAVEQMEKFKCEITEEDEEIRFLAMLLNAEHKEETKADLKILELQKDDTEKMIHYLGNTPPGVNISLGICFERIKEFVEFPKTLLVKSSVNFHKGRFRERPSIGGCKVFGGENLVVFAVDKNGNRCRTGGDVTTGTDCENGVYILDREKPFINNYPLTPRGIADIVEEERKFSEGFSLEGSDVNDPVLLDFFPDTALITPFGRFQGVKKYLEIPGGLVLLRDGNCELVDKLLESDVIDIALQDNHIFVAKTSCLRKYTLTGELINQIDIEFRLICNFLDDLIVGFTENEIYFLDCDFVFKTKLVPTELPENIHYLAQDSSRNLYFVTNELQTIYLL